MWTNSTNVTKWDVERASITSTMVFWGPLVMCCFLIPVSLCATRLSSLAWLSDRGPTAEFTTRAASIHDERHLQALRNCVHLCVFLRELISTSHTTVVIPESFDLITVMGVTNSAGSISSGALIGADYFLYGMRSLPLRSAHGHAPAVAHACTAAVRGVPSCGAHNFITILSFALCFINVTAYTYYRAVTMHIGHNSRRESIYGRTILYNIIIIKGMACLSCSCARILYCRLRRRFRQSGM